MTNARSEAIPHPKSGTQPAWVNHAHCILLSLIFLIAAIAKTQGFRELEATLAASKLVPVLLAPQTAVFLLILEYLLSILLLAPKTRVPALYAACALISIFVAYSTWRWMQGITIPCHCFGVLYKVDPWQAILLNLVLLSFAAHGLRYFQSRRKV